MYKENTAQATHSQKARFREAGRPRARHARLAHGNSPSAWGTYDLVTTGLLQRGPV